MSYPAAPISGIAASLGQATGYPAENYNRPKGRGIKPSSAAGGLKMEKQNLDNFEHKIIKLIDSLLKATYIMIK